MLFRPDFPMWCHHLAAIRWSTITVGMTTSADTSSPKARMPTTKPTARLTTSGGITPVNQKSRQLIRRLPLETLTIADMVTQVRLGLGYFYSNGSVGPICLVEGALEFLAMYTWHVTENVAPRPRFLPGTCPLTNIHQLDEATGHQENTIDPCLGNCPYYLGSALLSQVCGSTGQDVVSSSLRELCQMIRASPYPVTEEAIYPVFLSNIAAGKQHEFRDLYRPLHGGSVLDSQYRVSGSAYSSAPSFLFLPSWGPGAQRRKSLCVSPS
jgi:hypothetical protein